MLLNIPESQTSDSVENLRNSVIVALIVKDFDLAFISKISGISISSLENKWYYKVKSYEEDQIDKLINQGIAGIPYYSYL